MRKEEPGGRTRGRKRMENGEDEGKYSPGWLRTRAHASEDRKVKAEVATLLEKAVRLKGTTSHLSLSNSGERWNSCVEGEAALPFWEEGPLQVWPEGTALGRDSSGSAAAPWEEWGAAFSGHLSQKPKRKDSSQGPRVATPWWRFPATTQHAGKETWKTREEPVITSMSAQKLEVKLSMLIRLPKYPPWGPTRWWIWILLSTILHITILLFSGWVVSDSLWPHGL